MLRLSPNGKPEPALRAGILTCYLMEDGTGMKASTLAGIVALVGATLSGNPVCAQDREWIVTAYISMSGPQVAFASRF